MTLQLLAGDAAPMPRAGAHLSHLKGTVSLHPAQASDWSAACFLLGVTAPKGSSVVHRKEAVDSFSEDTTPPFPQGKKMSCVHRAPRRVPQSLQMCQPAKFSHQLHEAPTVIISK